MMFDFGCLSWHDKLAHSGSAMLGALACLYIFAGLSCLGAMARASFSYSIRDSLLGWGIISLLLTGLSIVFAQPLFYGFIMSLTVVTAAILFQARRGYFSGTAWKLAVSYGLLFLIAINLYGIGKWDDFSHWVPNAFYLWQEDGLPRLSLPAPHSVWPGYPYAVPFLTYLASHLAGGFLVTGGAMFNFLFLLGFAASLPQGLRQTNDFAIACLALLSITLLNPAFNASFTMTSQGDTPSMIVIAVMVMVFCDLLERLKAPQSGKIIATTLEASLLAILLVLIKQANIGILLFLVGSLVVVSFKNGVARRGVTVAVLLLALPLLVRAIWQQYVGGQMHDNGFVVLSLHAWRWDLAPTLLRAMGADYRQEMRLLRAYFRHH